MDYFLKRVIPYISIFILLLTITACSNSNNEFNKIEKYEASFIDKRNEYENSVELILNEISDYDLNEEYASYFNLKCFDDLHSINSDNDVYYIIFDEDVIEFMIDKPLLDCSNGYYYSLDGKPYDPIGYSIRELKNEAFYEYNDRILTKGRDFSISESNDKWEIIDEEEFESLKNDSTWYYLYRIDEHWFYYEIVK